MGKIMLKITSKDEKKLIDMPNDVFLRGSYRCLIENMPESILSFYENNKTQMDADVVILRSSEDVGFAAKMRNRPDCKTLFIFKKGFYADSYFTTTADKIVFPDAMNKRILS